MANFGDELRNAPNKVQQEAREKNLAWKNQYEAENRNIVNGAIEHFKKQCMAAARSGQRSINCGPDLQFHRGCIRVGYLAVLSIKSDMDRANRLIPAIESELAQMGLRSYSVSVTNATVPFSEKYLGFRIKATW